MDRVKKLEEKVRTLETRIKRLEKSDSSNSEDGKFMAALFEKAKEYVRNNDRVSVIKLQRKLYIDFQRASELYDRLKSDGLLK